MPNTYATAIVKDFQQSKSQLSEVDAINHPKFGKRGESTLGFPVSPGQSQQNYQRLTANKGQRQACNLSQFDSSNKDLLKADFGQRQYNTPLTQQRHRRRPLTTKMNQTQIQSFNNLKNLKQDQSALTSQQRANIEAQNEAQLITVDGRAQNIDLSRIQVHNYEFVGQESQAAPYQDCFDNLKLDP